MCSNIRPTKTYKVGERVYLEAIVKNVGECGHIAVSIKLPGEGSESVEALLIPRQDVIFKYTTRLAVPEPKPETEIVLLK